MAPAGLTPRSGGEPVPGREDEKQERSSLLLYSWLTCERPWELPVGWVWRSQRSAAGEKGGMPANFAT